MDAPSADIQILIQTALELVVAAGLGAARAMGIMLIFPVFTRSQISGLIRGCLAVGFALPCLAHVGGGLPALDSDTRLIQLTLLGFKEVFVGVLLGTFLGIPLWGLQAAGELIDNQRGISSPTASADPATNSQASAMGVFLGITAIAIFVGSGGLETLISVLYRSYLIWPVYQFHPTLSGPGAMELLGLLDRIMRTALLVSGPVVFFLILIDISMMLLRRFAPQFKASQLSPAIKNIVFPVLMVTYAAYLVESMKLEVTQANGALEWFDKLLP
ncbi:MAG: EscT/YscT/HrcT family type III secretion system export apparatus protein [Mesorhizobium sp.]|uniref:type III secretion system export apparatus subunit SctT n=1 Tax=Mesorhizobium sp. TaxID=1871066 RepID=UPI000FE3E856|nr:type III secretion system export apparatus subunit SctT [Mesorhizobium sp.]RWK24287.1 MAG: EscT/YscT/HrcT family type III secretion system export apparatus protein [Mesorhizobium sp.]RWK33191.1 MAG: EscT/YscT/HrcT family type III secretion system export apparatus protein [Mesorhizobium sp.]RWO13138.1 MAG: EscT/YscT/HrcT family type III secretion system export apparatus protein [Mesorhizobium sp.]RWQ24569.1 MAG: EscT/YscT/HrcT family type III secretion system export apparatus protein [Mesorhi